MKTIKGHCTLVIILIAACMIYGCTASPSSDYGSANVENEKYMEKTGVELFESREEPESMPTIEPLGSESGEELLSSLMAETLELENSEEVEYPSEEEIEELGIPEDMLAYWLVLNNKKPFISVNQEGQKFFWNEYFWYIRWVCDEYNAYQFMIVDVDRDGRKEIVLECDPGTKHILHCKDGEVYGYQFGLRGMLTISEDGIYDASDGAQDNYFYRITELNKDGYTYELLAELHGEHYEILGKKVTWEEFSEYVDDISAREAESMDYTENLLDNYLLGELSEQEIALVKRIPAENMLESELDYQEHKQALQLYAGVLKGEQDVIFVTEDTSPNANDIFARYFSLIDMDGDGSHELVFTCSDEVAWILHCDKGEVFGYHLRTSLFEPPVITVDGVFHTDEDEISPTGYARITAFEEDGYRIEPVEDYQKGSHDRVRYYFFSEEALAQWLE